MDTAYDKRKKHAQGMRFVKGKWEKVEFIKLDR